MPNPNPEAIHYDYLLAGRENRRVQQGRAIRHHR